MNKIAVAVGFLALVYSSPINADDPHIHGLNVPDWYDPACCSKNDCKPVADNDLEFIQLQNGTPAIRYVPTGNIFTHRDFKVSQDERYHVCINPNTKQSLCLYLRPGV